MTITRRGREGDLATGVPGAYPLPIAERVTAQSLHRRIEMFEAQRSMSSEQFMKAFRAGEEPETRENVEWARLITITQRLSQRY